MKNFIFLLKIEYSPEWGFFEKNRKIVIFVKKCDFSSFLWKNAIFSYFFIFFWKFEKTTYIPRCIFVKKCIFCIFVFFENFKKFNFFQKMTKNGQKMTKNDQKNRFLQKSSWNATHSHPRDYFQNFLKKGHFLKNFVNKSPEVFFGLLKIEKSAKKCTLIISNFFKKWQKMTIFLVTFWTLFLSIFLKNPPHNPWCIFQKWRKMRSPKN